MQRLKFEVHNYFTQLRENIYICGNIEQLGDGDRTRAVLMKNVCANFWYIEIDIETDKIQNCQISYFYFTEKQSNTRQFKLPWIQSNSQTISIIDDWSLGKQSQWNTKLMNTIHYGNKNTEQASCLHYLQFQCTFQILVPYFEEDQQIFISGNVSELGQWDVANKVQLHHVGNRVFSSYQINFSKHQNQVIEYKFLIKHNNSVTWESGPNRKISGGSFVNGFFQYPNHIEKRYSDLLEIAKFCKQANLQIIQLSNQIIESTCSQALNAVYISLGSIQNVTKNVLDEIDSESLDENEQLYTKKIQLLREVFDNHHDNYKNQTDTIIKQFAEQNQWVKLFSIYCTKNEIQQQLQHFGTMSDIQKRKFLLNLFEDRQQCFSETINKEINYIIWSQYQLHDQFQQVCDKINQMGISLQFVYDYSCIKESMDVWLYSDLFDIDLSVGYPPTRENTDGQTISKSFFNIEKCINTQSDYLTNIFNKIILYFDSCQVSNFSLYIKPWVYENNHTIQHGYYYNSKELSKQLLSNTHYGIDRFTQPYITDEFFATFKLRQDTLEQFKNQLFTFNEQFQQYTINTNQQQQILQQYSDELQKIFQQIVQNTILITAENGQLYPNIINSIPNQFNQSFNNFDDAVKTQIFNYFNEYYSQYQFEANSIYKKICYYFKNTLSNNNTLLVVLDDQQNREFNYLHNEYNFLINYYNQNNKYYPQFEWNYQYMSQTQINQQSIKQWWKDQQYQQFYKQNQMNDYSSRSTQPQQQQVIDIIRKQLHTKSMINLIDLEDWLIIYQNNNYFENKLINLEMFIENCDQICSVIRTELYKAGR